MGLFKGMKERRAEKVAKGDTWNLRRKAAKIERVDSRREHKLAKKQINQLDNLARIDKRKSAKDGKNLTNLELASQGIDHKASTWDGIKNVTKNVAAGAVAIVGISKGAGVANNAIDSRNVDMSETVDDFSPSGSNGTPPKITLKKVIDFVFGKKGSEKKMELGNSSFAATESGDDITFN